MLGFKNGTRMILKTEIYADKKSVSICLFRIIGVLLLLG